LLHPPLDPDAKLKLSRETRPIGGSTKEDRAQKLKMHDRWLNGDSGEEESEASMAHNASVSSGTTCVVHSTGRGKPARKPVGLLTRLREHQSIFSN
jgi:hypothetical protein